MKFVRQRDSHDCGVACLVMVCQHYGRNISLERTRQLCHIKRTGVSLLGISEAAEIMGLRTQGVLCDLDTLQEINLPAILHWHQNHFVVLTRIEKKAEMYYSTILRILQFNKSQQNTPQRCGLFD